MDYFENNKKQQALLTLLASYGIEVPNNIDAHSVEWILDMIYLKFDSKELKKFMNVSKVYARFFIIRTKNRLELAIEFQPVYS